MPKSVTRAATVEAAQPELPPTAVASRRSRPALAAAGCGYTAIASTDPRLVVAGGGGGGGEGGQAGRPAQAAVTHPEQLALAPAVTARTSLPRRMPAVTVVLQRRMRLPPSAREAPVAAVPEMVASGRPDRVAQVAIPSGANSGGGGGGGGWVGGSGGGGGDCPFNTVTGTGGGGGAGASFAEASAGTVSIAAGWRDA